MRGTVVYTHEDGIFPAPARMSLISHDSLLPSACTAPTTRHCESETAQGPGNEGVGGLSAKYPMHVYCSRYWGKHRTAMCSTTSERPQEGFKSAEEVRVETLDRR